MSEHQDTPTGAILDALRTKNVEVIAGTRRGDLYATIDGMSLEVLRHLCLVWGIAPDAARLDDVPDTPLHRATVSLNIGIERALEASAPTQCDA